MSFKDNITMQCIRTCSDLEALLEEYRGCLGRKSETTFNKVIALDSNMTMTMKGEDDDTYRMDTFVYPDLYNGNTASKVCNGMNTKMKGYSHCGVVSYKTWLEKRIEQIEHDIQIIKK